MSGNQGGYYAIRKRGQSSQQSPTRLNTEQSQRNWNNFGVQSSDLYKNPHYQAQQAQEAINLAQINQNYSQNQMVEANVNEIQNSDQMYISPEHLIPQETAVYNQPINIYDQPNENIYANNDQHHQLSPPGGDLPQQDINMERESDGGSLKKVKFVDPAQNYDKKPQTETPAFKSSKKGYQSMSDHYDQYSSSDDGKTVGSTKKVEPILKKKEEDTSSKKGFGFFNKRSTSQEKEVTPKMEQKSQTPPKLILSPRISKPSPARSHASRNSYREEDLNTSLLGIQKEAPEWHKYFSVFNLAIIGYIIISVILFFSVNGKMQTLQHRVINQERTISNFDIKIQSLVDDLKSKYGVQLKKYDKTASESSNLEKTQNSKIKLLQSITTSQKSKIASLQKGYIGLNNEIKNLKVFEKKTQAFIKRFSKVVSGNN